MSYSSTQEAFHTVGSGKGTHKAPGACFGLGYIRTEFLSSLVTTGSLLSVSSSPTDFESSEHES